MHAPLQAWQLLLPLRMVVLVLPLMLPQLVELATVLGVAILPKQQSDNMVC